jgi:hypothetical protein
MKKYLFFALSFAAGMILAGCLSLSTTKTVDQPQAETAPPPPEMKEEYVSEKPERILVDSKTKPFGIPTPDWVANYIATGKSAVERMPEYKEMTVFVGEETGTNLQGLQAWGNNFSANFLISSRLTNSFDSTAKGAGAGATGSTTSGAPPANFENYIETLKKNTTNATFHGAAKESDWWGKFRIYKNDGKTIEREEYVFYILVTMDKPDFESQFKKLLSDAASATYSNTPERNRAIDLVRNGWNSLP